MRKAKGPYKAMLVYRNTNIEEIPTASPLLSAATSSSDIKMRMETRKGRQKLNFDRHAGKELRSLSSDENVVIQNGKNWVSEM